MISARPCCYGKFIFTCTEKNLSLKVFCFLNNNIWKTYSEISRCMFPMFIYACLLFSDRQQNVLCDLIIYEINIFELGPRGSLS